MLSLLQQRQQFVDTALKAAREIYDVRHRIAALMGLLQCPLPSETRQRLLEEVLSAARSIRDPRECFQALSGPGPQLPPEQRSAL